MTQGRRSFLGSVVLALGSSAFIPACLGEGPPGAQGEQGKQFPPMPTPPPEPKFDARALLKQRQKEIKKDVERLVELAAELKKEVEKTDSAEVLSLHLVRRAEEIEKLAKRIKSLARD